MRALLLAASLVLLGLPAPAETVRVATYNVALDRDEADQLLRELTTRPRVQVSRLVAVLRHVRPDIVLLNEIDYDPEGAAVSAFVALLAAADGSGEPLVYDHVFSAPVNTGVDSGLDLDGDGERGGPGDAWGWGHYPGQYGMAILSRFPFDREAVRTFQHFRWLDLPENLLPTDFYGEAAAVLRLSSKSHWDVPVQIGEHRLHLLASHPTPPVFDGPERRNQRRNADEVRFWELYLDGGWRGGPVDDQGRVGGLAPRNPFVILGDLNLDPFDGDGRHEVMRSLLDHPRIQDPEPRSLGAVEAAARQGGANRNHVGDPALDTSNWRPFPGPGNLRVDYVLPAASLRVVDAGVFWPADGEVGHDWVRDRRASDHHLVWVDLALE
ncbi:MAG: endonuclease/exonuclease/phosphatase family protein [Geminicoccaceae bacterium]|nr:MAG: endonuclease/exonuclease/phosphatase family protein [Geminicoccaceae bacterium]